MEKITSLQNPKIRDAARLHTSRGRKQQNRIIVFGQRELRRAIKCGFEIEAVFVCGDESNSGAVQSLAADVSQIQFYDVSREVFDKLSYGDRGDAFIGVAKRPATSLGSFKPRGSGPIVVLEAIEKPGNLGAVFRSADATSVGGVILSNPGCDFLHPNAIRNSMGATFAVPAATGSNEETIRWLADEGYSVFVATPDQATALFQTKLPTKHAMVLGNEANGLSERWLAGEFQPVSLPMQGICDSLNVSVTAAVMMYESLRQRTSG